MTTFLSDGEGGHVNLHRLSPEQGAFVSSLLSGPHGGMDKAAMDIAIRRYKKGDYSFEHPILDRSPQELVFNVMNGREVTERLTPRGYFVGSDIARVVFDRDYQTSMEKSPSHVIFLSALVQWQKLIYVIMCHRCGLTYDAQGPELFKIWPTEVHCRMPTLVREEQNLTEDAFVSRLECVGAGAWRVEGFAVVNKRLGLAGRAMIHRLS